MQGYRTLSFWLDDLDGDLTPRPPMAGSIDVDVAIVGGGYSGLWTAYYLKRADPSLRIAVVEAEICGFGASGRNGGWCSALFAGARQKSAKRHGRGAAIAMQRAMFSTVDEVGRVLGAEGIDANWHKGGTLTLATTPAQEIRLRQELDGERSWGFTEDDFVWLDEAAARARIDAAGVRGGLFTPHCARVHPAKLVRGLAGVVVSSGVSVYEQTRATSIEPGRVTTFYGDVKADVVVRATEGYTARQRGRRRFLLPLYSMMIATEPLPAAFWREAGWSNRETMNDGRHLIIYSQRTADDRIAFGGRGAPYHFGSRIEDEYDCEPRVFELLRHSLVSLFPAAADARITHRWGGPLGVPRDWYTSVGFDRMSGMAWAGGYVGDGVSTANLAGRTLTDLVLGRASELTRLPWVGHASRSWEPEPLRWIGVNLGRILASGADHEERRTGRPARLGWVVDRLTGH
jgi:glycine/D-amino acid oxidase-like deaminating enzyme